MAVMIHPWIALVLVAVFGLFYWFARSWFVLIAAILWLAYFVYEYAMKLRILCSGECNIRIDLLVLYPLLILVSAVALIVFIVRVSRRGSL